jgi:hypothetical protein
MTTAGKADRERFRLEIQDAGNADSTPAIIRLRHLLKNMGRQWHLRCTRAVKIDAQGREFGLDDAQNPDPKTPQR